MIKNANIDDLNKVAKVHIRCFPDSFSTQLGEKILLKYYLEYFKENPELFYVALDNDKIIGF